MFNKHNTVHPAPKQVAWLNLPVGAGPQIREFTKLWEPIAKACARIMNLWVRIQKPRVWFTKSELTDWKFVCTVY